MSDTSRIISNQTILTVDYERRLVSVQYPPSDKKMHPKDLCLPFSVITGMELKKPRLMSGGSVSFLIQGTRLVNHAKGGKAGMDPTEYKAAKEDYEALHACMQRLAEILQVPLAEKGSTSVPETEYDHAFDAQIEPQVYRRCCRACKKIYQFSDLDLMKKQEPAGQSNKSMMLGMSEESGSRKALVRALRKKQEELPVIRDYRRCPYCNSEELTELTEEEYTAAASAGAKTVSVVQGISEADEIRKFKGLLDDGLITQEEYEEKRKQLLGL